MSTSTNKDHIYDYIVIGSGFGGSVSAMRLAEKGYSVLVLEKGKKHLEKDIPKTNWNVRKFFWAPLLRCFGPQKMTFFKEVFILSGVGVGGGSTIYANTHFEPPDAFYQNNVWSHFRDWKKTLRPFYDRARFMLGTTRNNKLDEEDRILKELAADMGREDSWSPVEVGVYLDQKNGSADPYFGGLGPKREACQDCANCMVGCKHGAKNTLDKNYLHFAAEYGAEIVAETEVVRIEKTGQGYALHTRSSTSLFRKKGPVYRSKGLVISGGVLGTLDLLFRQKYKYNSLPDISDSLGDNLRTNSESLCGVTAADRKLNHGIAISSVFNPDDHTHVEVVKYGSGSGVMGRLATLATGDGNALTRTAKLMGNTLRHPWRTLRFMFNFNWANNSVVLLVMQTLDNRMKMIWKKGIFGQRMSMENRGKNRVPAYIDIGQEVMKNYAAKANGIAMNAIPEVLFNMSSTAHILGGCPMSSSPEKGVVDDCFRVHNYDNFYILDGSIIPCNLGVNPSLTITALSEYAMDKIPPKTGSENRTLEQRMADLKKERTVV